MVSISRQTWPLFAMILRDWSGSLGVEPVGMARVLQAGTAARMAIALSVAGAALALWVAVQGRPRRRVARIGAGGVALALIAWPFWAVAQDYLFLYSILPGLWTWLAAASGLTGLSLAAVALLPERMR